MEIERGKPEVQETPQAYKGLCFIFYETGYEGSPWAFQDKNFMTLPEEGFPHGKWSYEGLHILEDGDELTVFSPDQSEEVVWNGKISLMDFTPQNVGIEDWKQFFIKQYPAELTPKPTVPEAI